MIIFSILWFTFAYLPISHMVWYWDGPDAYTSAKAGDLANSHAGFIFQRERLISRAARWYTSTRVSLLWCAH